MSCCTGQSLPPLASASPSIKWEASSYLQKHMFQCPTFQFKFQHCCLCDLRQVTYPLCASESLFCKMGLGTLIVYFLEL